MMVLLLRGFYPLVAMLTAGCLPQATPQQQSFVLMISTDADARRFVDRLDKIGGYRVSRTDFLNSITPQPNYNLWARGVDIAVIRKPPGLSDEDDDQPYGVTVAYSGGLTDIAETRAKVLKEGRLVQQAAADLDFRLKPSD